MPKDLSTTDTYGWTHQFTTECDSCHNERPCCTAEYNDGAKGWDYCKTCWQELGEQGALPDGPDGNWS